MNLTDDTNRLCKLLSSKYGIPYDDLVRLTLAPPFKHPKSAIRYDAELEAYTYHETSGRKIFCDGDGNGFAYLDCNGSIEPLQ
jgi:hypothetical protein